MDAASVTLPDAPPGQAESTAAQWLETLLLAIATSLVVSQPGNIFVKVLVVIGGSTLATVAQRGRVSVSFITLGSTRSNDDAAQTYTALASSLTETELSRGAIGHLSA